MQQYKDKTLYVNVSDNKQNYSQRNNLYKHSNAVLGVEDVNAGTMCNGTSLCQTGDYNGIIFPDGKFDQPEDNFLDFVMTDPRVDAYYAKAMPVLYKDYKTNKSHINANGKIVLDYYTPNEVHPVLAYAFNLWVGFEADKFVENAKIFDIVNELLEGRSCVISGVFNGLNHIVSLVGCEWTFKEDQTGKQVYSLIKQITDNKILPTKFIIDDPYGKWNAPNGYKSGQSGNDAELTLSEFIKMIKPTGNANIKYCHFVRSGAAVV